MPSLKEAIVAGQARQAQGVSYVSPSPSLSASVPSVEQQSPNLPSRGNFVPSAVVGTDFKSSSQVYRNAQSANIRTPSFLPQNGSNFIQQVKTIIESTSATTAGASGILLETAGQKNPKQNLLNFVTNMDLTWQNLFNLPVLEFQADVFGNETLAGSALANQITSEFFGAPASQITTFTFPFFNYLKNSSGGSATTGTLTLNPTFLSWNSSTPEVAGNLIVDSNNNVQRCTTSGTTGTSVPTWATGVGQTTNDFAGGGTVVWTCVKYQISQGDTIFFNASLDPNPGPAGNSINSLTDNFGNLYTQAAPTQFFSNAGSRQQSSQTFTAVANANIPYGTALTITALFGASSWDLFAGTFSFLGPKSQTPVQFNATGTTAWSSGSLTISNHELLISVSGSEITESTSAPWTVISVVTGADTVEAAYYNPAAAGTYSDTWTSGSPSNVCSTLFAFTYTPVMTNVRANTGIPVFRLIQNFDLYAAIFGASGLFHNPGAVPDPGAVQNNVHYLREDATWSIPLFGRRVISAPSYVTTIMDNDLTFDLQPGASKVTLGPTFPKFVGALGYNQVSGSSSTVTLSVTVTAGQTMVATIRWNSAANSVSTVTDGGSNTWTAVPGTLQQVNLGGGLSGSQQLWTAPVTTGGTFTITVTMSTSVPFPQISGGIFSGCDPSNPVDQHNSSSSASSVSPTTGSITTTAPNANEALYASFFTNGNNTGVPTGWTLISNPANTFFQDQYEIVSATGTYTGTQASGSFPYDGAIVSLKGPSSNAAAAVFNGFIQNNSGGTITIVPGTGLINGATSLTLPDGDGVWIGADGTNYTAVGTTINLKVNGAAIAGSIANFNGSIPAIPTNDTGVTFQADTSTPVTNISAYVNAQRQWNMIAQTSAYNAAIFDYVLANATSAGFTVTLPATAAANKGYSIVVVKTDSSTNNVTVATTGTDKVLGASSKAIARQYDAVVLTSDGNGNWWVS